MKKILMVAVLLALCGCSIFQTHTLAPPARNSQVCGPLGDGKGLELRVCVIPRLGLFSDLTWTSIKQYRAALESVADQEFGNNLKSVLGRQGAWDWLTTVERSHPEDLDRDEWRKREAKKQIAFRHVRVSVHKDGIAAASCKFTVDGLSDEHQCGESTTIAFDDSRTIKVKAVIDGANVDLRGKIPRDKLIVAMGDSYMSGEGNPDVPIRSRSASFEDDKPTEADLPWWEDQRCHRSMWAWPTQLALKMANSPTNDQPMAASVSGYKVIANQGVTLISTACSGAEIYDGLLSRYRGKESLSDIQESLKRLSITQPFGSPLPILDDGDKWLYQQKRLRMQIEQVEDFLPKMNGNREIDLLLLSVGGNDIDFAGLIQQSMLESTHAFTSERNGSIIKGNIAALESDYNVLPKEMAQKLPAIQSTVITQYPNPNWKSSGLDDLCEDTLFLPFLYIGKSKAGFITDSVVKPLNSAISKAANKHGWAVVDVNEGDTFHSHGWCTSYDGDPFGNSARWFRKFGDANEVQGPIPGGIISSGVMHPTFAAHRAVSEKVFQVLTDGEAHFKFSSQAENVARVADGAEPAGKEVRVEAKVGTPGRSKETATVDGCSKQFQYRLNGDGWKDCTPGNSCKAEADNSYVDALTFNIADLRLPQVNGIVELKLQVRGVAANCIRTTSEPVRYRADIEPPSITVPPLQWTNEESRSIQFSATDNPGGYGVKDWYIQGDDGRLTCSEPTDSLNSNERAICTVTTSREAETLKVSVIDNVGNESIPVDVPTHLDRTPPEIKGIVIDGYVFAPSDPKVVLLREGNAATLGIIAEDDKSGVGTIEIERAKAVKCRPGGTHCYSVTPSISELDAGVFARAIDVTDGAGNLAHTQLVNTTLQLISLRGKSKRTAANWRRQLSKDDRLKDLFAAAQTLRGRTEEGIADISSSEWPQVAAWLNLLSGRIAPDQVVTRKQKCLDNSYLNDLWPTNVDEKTAYALAMAATRNGTQDAETALRCLFGE